MTLSPDERVEMIRRYYKAKDFTGWFDELYARADGDSDVIPWAHLTPNPYLVEWLDREGVVGNDKQAMVIGCGLGDDAEALAKRGFVVTAFDISERAIGWCHERFPESAVTYQVADLLQLTTEWHQNFDFVFESLTVQALPQVIREAALQGVASLVAPGGTLLLFCWSRKDDEPVTTLPFPISKKELGTLLDAGLQEKQFEEFWDDIMGHPRFRVVYHRPA